MINDKELRKDFRELFYLCDNFFANSNEKRFVIYIIEKIEEIEEYISTNYSDNQFLNELKSDFPKIDKTGLDKLARSVKEKIISGFFFFLIIPSFLGRIHFADPNVLDSLKDKSEFNDKTRGKVRNLIAVEIANISKLAISALDKVK